MNSAEYREFVDQRIYLVEENYRFGLHLDPNIEAKAEAALRKKEELHRQRGLDINYLIQQQLAALRLARTIKMLGVFSQN